MHFYFQISTRGGIFTLFNLKITNKVKISFIYLIFLQMFNFILKFIVFARKSFWDIFDKHKVLRSFLYSLSIKLEKKVTLSNFFCKIILLGRLLRLRKCQLYQTFFAIFHDTVIIPSLQLFRVLIVPVNCRDLEFDLDRIRDSDRVMELVRYTLRLTF